MDRTNRTGPGPNITVVLNASEPRHDQSLDIQSSQDLWCLIMCKLVAHNHITRPSRDKFIVISVI